MEQGLASPQSAHRLSENDVQAVDNLRTIYSRLRQELARVIVGPAGRDRTACRCASSHAAMPF